MTKSLWFRSGRPTPAPSGFTTPGAVAVCEKHPLAGRLSQPLRTSAGRSIGSRSSAADDPAIATLRKKTASAGNQSALGNAPVGRSRQHRQALRFSEQYGARTWIDHQPYTNCEALTNRGFQGGRDGIADLLEQHSYRYAWSGIDVPASHAAKPASAAQENRSVRPGGLSRWTFGDGNTEQSVAVFDDDDLRRKQPLFRAV